jgi:hypothetical protein
LEGVWCRHKHKTTQLKRCVPLSKASKMWWIRFSHCKSSSIWIQCNRVLQIRIQHCNMYVQLMNVVVVWKYNGPGARSWPVSIYSTSVMQLCTLSLIIPDFRSLKSREQWHWIS